MQFVKDGRTFEFELKIDKVIDEESKDPDYCILDELASFEKGRPRFTSFERLAGFIGTDTDSLKKEGINLMDLVQIFTGCIEELGFTSDA